MHALAKEEDFALFFRDFPKFKKLAFKSKLHGISRNSCMESEDMISEKN